MAQKRKIKWLPLQVISKDALYARLPDEATIFSTEEKAIEIAFEYMYKMSK